MNRRFLKILGLIAVILLTAAVTFFGTWGFAVKQYADKLQSDSVKAKMEEVNRYLDAYFIDDYEEDVLVQAAADGAAYAMVAATEDEWSYYIPAGEMQAHEEQSNNSYVGIGITIEEAENGMRVATVTKGGPAHVMGMMPGDIILQVEGVSTVELGMDGTKNMVRGEDGTVVSLTLLRGEETLELSVPRAVIVSDVAEAELLENAVGYITIYNFDAHCAEQTLACIDDMVAQGAKALLFDVRFNPGGYKDEMVRVLDVLLPEGDVFRQVDYAGEELVDRSDAACLQMPMAVLVNKESYSAAEFFAAALQEYGVAEIVGSQTYGKGNFQYTFELSDGSGLVISCGKYYTPQGRSLTGVGVTPDVLIDLEEAAYWDLYYSSLEREEDAQFLAAMDILRQKIS